MILIIKWNKKWLILLITVTIWIVVSVFFYTEHLLTEKTMSIPGWEISQEDMVQVKEIRVFNKTLKGHQWPTGITLWVFESELIPDRMKILYLRLVNFYRFRYKSDDAWYIEISGVYPVLDPKDTTGMPEITIKVDGKYVYLFSMGNQGSEDSNFRFFTVRGKSVDPNIKKIEVTSRWNDKTKINLYETYFNTNTYSFFSPKPRDYDNFDPVLVANKYFWDYIKNRNDETIEQLKWTKEHILQGISISNPSANYLGDYKGFRNVLTVRMNYILSHPAQEKVDGIQDFYLIERDGVLEVIDIGEYKNILPEQNQRL